MENTGRYIIIHEYRYYFFLYFILQALQKRSIYFIYIHRICFSHGDSGVTSLAAVAAAEVATVVVLMQQHVTHISKHRFPLARPYIYICIFVCVGSLSN